mmetsp:Transcript_24885/g.40970  ORF Transcript_24885/g.40970 Transcript_24885/m.40970 type:complete len:372 (+) Transcript_24885:36-1151(+)
MQTLFAIQHCRTGSFARADASLIAFRRAICSQGGSGRAPVVCAPRTQSQFHSSFLARNRSDTSFFSRQAFSTFSFGSLRHGLQRHMFELVCALPSKLQGLVSTFQMAPDPKARYRELLAMADFLKGFPPDQRTDANKVRGCVSQVWVLGRLAEDGTIQYVGDSDSALTKGLVAVLINGLSGSPPEQIISVTPDFITDLGLKQSLTPSRNNGFLNMLKRMQQIATELSPGSVSTQVQVASVSETPKAQVEEIVQTPMAEPVQEIKESKPADAPSDNGRPVYTFLKNKLEEQLKPVSLNIIDESYKHAGHAGAVGYNGESHFRVEIVSSAFEGRTQVARHRQVYSAVNDLMRNGKLHALSLDTKTPKEAGVAA